MDDLETIEIDLLLEAVFRRCGHDFRSYARASVARRVQKAVSACGCATISELTGKVLREPEALAHVVQSFSIPVTEMFRDPFVFRTLREAVLPVLRTWPHIRAWCAGCATGEEVYSLAIVLREEGLHKKSMVYATDFSDVSLEKARHGVYSTEDMQLATRNYQQSGGRESFSEYYHARYNAAVIDSSMKEWITFANHNLTSDKVFSEMQLIFCRNVLIYFNRDLQNQVLRLFTESLVHGGFLCLGTKESLRFTDVCDQYEVVDRKAKIYRKTAR